MIDSWIERDNERDVFKFELVAIEDDESRPSVLHDQPVRRRIIPTRVKLEVWKRDKGMCVICGATDELHFDHIIPFSKGGTSLTAENIQLLCARHNIEKRDKIK
jgi:5-methylcytosine-specific restriction endonuclease McrA